MKKIIAFILFCLSISFTLNAQEPIKIFERHFIKEKKVLVRIAPINKKSFDLINTNALKVSRFEVQNGKLINELVIVSLLKSYWEADTAKWMKLLRKDKDKTAFIYQALFQNKADQKLNSQQKQKQEKMLFDLMLLSCDFDADIAKACGLFFIDSTINNKNNYVYKIAVYTSSVSGISKELLEVKVDPSVLSTNKKIVSLNGKSKNKVSTLKWKAIDYTNDYSGYNIERSEDSLMFKKINKTPVILMSSQFEKNKEFVFYNDTMPQPNKKYFYRIRGINFFGEESEPSNIAVNYSSPPINSIPLIDTIVVLENTRVTINWRMENNAETNLVKSYLLARAPKDNGNYKIIFESKDKRKFVDLNPQESNFYKVGAITYNNDTIYSYSRMATIIDATPPATPVGFKATVDKKGNVTIKWNKNKEADLQGYKLFKANALNEEFVQVNNKFITDTFYNQKLNLKTLSKKIYFALAASDNNFNSSVKCLPIEVRRPDTIPPAAPILKSVYPERNGVKLSFILSKSEDVLIHIISRKLEGDSDFVNVKGLSLVDSTGVFLDTAAELGKTYTYFLSAVDEDDNISKSKGLVIKYETGFRKKLTTINYAVDRTQKNISLNWTYNEKDIEKFILYRKKENEPLTIIKTVNGNTLSYIDKTPNIGNIYEYRIKAVLHNGAESIISDAVKVTY